MKETDDNSLGSINKSSNNISPQLKNNIPSKSLKLLLIHLLVIIIVGIGGYILYLDNYFQKESQSIQDKQELQIPTPTVKSPQNDRRLLLEKQIEGDNITAYRLKDELSYDGSKGQGRGVFTIIIDDGINKYYLFSISSPNFSEDSPFEVINNEIWVVNGQTDKIDVYSYKPEIREGKNATTGYVNYKYSLDMPKNVSGSPYSIKCEENTCLVNTAIHMEAGCRMNLNTITKQYSDIKCSSLNEDLKNLDK